MVQLEALRPISCHTARPEEARLCSGAVFSSCTPEGKKYLSGSGCSVRCWLLMHNFRDVEQMVV